MAKLTGSDLVGEDGLLAYEEINTVPLLVAAAAAGLIVACVVTGYVVHKLFSVGLDRAWDREYWVKDD